MILKESVPPLNTLKVRLRELVEGGYLVKQGKGKSTVYALGDRSSR